MPELPTSGLRVLAVEFDDRYVRVTYQDLSVGDDDPDVVMTRMMMVNPGIVPDETAELMDAVHQFVDAALVRHRRPPETIRRR